MSKIYTLGYLQDKSDTRDFIYSDVFRSLLTPPEVDYRPEMPRIRSQGAAGACVAFAFTSAKAWQESAQRKFKEHYVFSPKFLYSYIQQYPGGGSYPRDALKVMQKIGVPLESQYPYGSRNTDKHKLEPPIKNRETLKMFNTARRFRIGGYARIRTVNEAMQTLSSVGPFQIGMEWLDGWFNRAILKPNQGRVAGGHAVSVCGYSRRDKHFIIHNSWGNDWGDRGYGYLTFDAFEKHGIDSWVCYDHLNSLLK